MLRRVDTRNTDETTIPEMLLLQIGIPLLTTVWVTPLLAISSVVQGALFLLLMLMRGKTLYVYRAADVLLCIGHVCGAMFVLSARYRTSVVVDKSAVSAPSQDNKVPQGRFYHLQKLWADPSSGTPFGRRVSSAARRYIGLYYIAVCIYVAIYVAHAVEILVMILTQNSESRWFKALGAKEWDAPTILMFVTTAFNYAMLWGVAVGTWVLSMIVATTLANDPLQDITQSLKHLPAAPSDVEWETEVEAPVIRVASVTMVHLSEGWGAEVPLVLLQSVCGPLAGIMWIVFKFRSQGFSFNHLSVWVPWVSGWIFVLASTLYAFASVSTKCDDLMEAMNDYRLIVSHGENWRPDFHLRLESLTTALRNSNGGSGMGFMVFGFVIDLKTLRRLCVVLAGTAPGLISLLMDYTDKDIASLKEAAAAAALGQSDNSSLCELTDAQLNNVQDLLTSFNVAYNVTNRC